MREKEKRKVEIQNACTDYYKNRETCESLLESSKGKLFIGLSYYLEDYVFGINYNHPKNSYCGNSACVVELNKGWFEFQQNLDRARKVMDDMARRNQRVFGEKASLTEKNKNGI